MAKDKGERKRKRKKEKVLCKGTVVVIVRATQVLKKMAGSHSPCLCFPVCRELVWTELSE